MKTLERFGFDNVAREVRMITWGEDLEYSSNQHKVRIVDNIKGVVMKTIF